MKRYILTLMIGLSVATASAQFTGTDSLRNFNNRFINNNASQAFTNLRLHNLLAGMIDFIDSAQGGSSIALGIDTMYVTSDSVFHYKKNGVFRSFVIRGNPGAGSLAKVPFSNGLGRFDNDSNFTYDRSQGLDAGRLIVGPTGINSGGLSKINSTSDNMNALALTSYGTGLNTVIFRRAEGTLGTPVALTSGKDLWNFSGRGYTGTIFTQSRAAIYAQTSQNWTDTTNGTRLYFATTDNDSTVLKTRMTIDQDGRVFLNSYPKFTRGTDTSAVKALGYDTLTGKLIPMKNWSGSGGSGDSIKYTNTAFVDSAFGSDATGVLDRLDKPFKTIDAALDAGAAVAALRVKIGFGSYVHPTPSKIRNYLWLEGSGKPGHNGIVSMTAYGVFSNTAPTKLKGGTIILGNIGWQDHGFIKISDLGVDQGSAYVSGGGTEYNGINGGSATTVAPFPIMQGLEVKNVICLLKDPNSLFHGIIFENAIEPRIDNCDVIFGTHGIVLKSIGGTITNVKISDCATDAIIVKSDSYAFGLATQINGFEVSSTFSTYTSGGIYALMATGPAMSGIKISNGTIRQSSYGVQVIGSCDNLEIDNVKVIDVTGNGFSVDNAAFVRVSNCYARACAGDGFHIDATSGPYLNIANCMAVGNSGDGFDLNSGAGKIDCNNVYSRSNVGYGLRAGSNVNLNVYFFDNNTAGNITGTPTIQLAYLTRNNDYTGTNTFANNSFFPGNATFTANVSMGNVITIPNFNVGLEAVSGSNTNPPIAVTQTQSGNSFQITAYSPNLAAGSWTQGLRFGKNAGAYNFIGHTYIHTADGSTDNIFYTGYANGLHLTTGGQMSVGYAFGTLPTSGMTMDINGKLMVKTIDSIVGPFNVLTQTINGEIKKAAVPSNTNIANASLTANGSYTQDWNHNPLTFNNINQWSFNVKENDGVFGTRKVKHVFQTSNNYTAQPLNLYSSIRNLADNADSILTGYRNYGAGGLQYSGLITTSSAATGRIEIGLFDANVNVSKGARSSGIALDTTRLIVTGSDSILIKGAIASSSADSLYAVGTFNSDGSNTLKKVARGAKVISDFYTDANNTGTGETDLYTSTISANTLVANGQKLISDFAGTFNDATATGQLKFYFAGTLIGNTGTLTLSATGGWSARLIVIRTGTTTARALVSVTTPGASTAVYTTETDLTGLDFTTNNDLKNSGTAGGAGGGSNDITAKLGTVIFQPAAN